MDLLGPQKAPASARQIESQRKLVERDLREASEFAEHLEWASKIVAGWPDWKRSVLGGLGTETDFLSAQEAPQPSPAVPPELPRAV